jgi:radical SAM superfamily enzyme YgiQ (UPF0313 family)
VVLAAPRSPELRHSGDYITGGVTTNVPLGLYNLKAVVDCSALADEFEVIVAGREVTQDFGDHALARWVLSHQPALVGLGSYLWNEGRNDALAATIRAAAPGVRIVGGGPHFLHDADLFLKQNLNYDAVVVGEGEDTFVELLDATLGNRDLCQVQSLVWRDGEEVVVNPPRPLIDPLDRIPSPYLTGACNVEEWGTLDTESQRGCPWNCAYCAYAGGALVQEGPYVRHFRPERTVAELALATERHVSSAYIMDPDFLSKRRRAIELCEALAEVNRGPLVRIHAELRAEAVDGEVAEALWLAGVRSVEVGVQSISPDVAEMAGRRNDLGRISAGVRRMLAKGIDVHVGLIVGLPGDDGTAALKTLHWIRSLGAKPDVFLLSVVRGSRFWKEKERFGLKHLTRAPHYVTHNGVIGQPEIAAAVAACLRTQAAYEERRSSRM